MARMGCISRPGVKHNAYATISVNRTTIAENGSLFPQSYGMQTFLSNDSKNGYYTDDFTLTITARANGEDLYYQITGTGAETARFYQSSSSRGSDYSTSWSQNPDGSTSTTNSLTGRIGNLSSATWTKCAFANPTTSNTNDTATSTTFSVNLRTRNATTGTILSTTPTITCYKFRFVIDCYIDGSAGLYQNSTVTIPAERNAQNQVGSSRNIYPRLMLPLNTVYNVINMFANLPNNGLIGIIGGSTTPSVTVGNDTSSSCSWIGWWDAYGGQYWYAGGAVYSDNTTEAIEYFRFRLQWNAFYGLSNTDWTISQNHAIAANTT